MASSRASGLRPGLRRPPLADFHAPPLLLEVLKLPFCGSVRPMPTPALAAFALLLLLLTELFLTVLVLTSLCTLPDAHNTGCIVTLSAWPFAVVLSPIVCLVLLFHVVRVLRGVAKGQDTALCRASSGFVTRRLRVAAYWNATSFCSAFVAQIAFVMTPELMHDTFEASLLWAL